MIRIVFCALILLRIVVGLQIIEPNSTTIWSTQGPNTILWIHEASDPSDITIIFESDRQSIFTVASGAQEYVTTDQFTATDYAFIQILAGQTLTSEQFSIEQPETSATTTATYAVSATAAATPPGTKSGTESGAATIKPSSILTVFGLVIGMLIL